MLKGCPCGKNFLGAAFFLGVIKMFYVILRQVLIFR